MATAEKELVKAQAGPGLNLPVLDNLQQAIDVMKTNLEGVSVQFDRVKIPSGGGLAFEVPSESGEAVVAQEIVGVILDHYRVNAYWANKFSGQGNPPDCASLNGRTGDGEPGGDCSKCPLNQYGSDENRRGKACKNIHRVYVLPENEIFPWLVALPPGSLKFFNQYIQRLTSKLRPFYSVVTRIKLQKAKNKDGIEYSQAVLSKVADLEPGQAMSLKQYIQQIKPVMRAVAVAADEYNTEDHGEAAGGNGATGKGPDPY